jgi:hypothetical protein
MCLFNVILYPMLGLLLILFNALCTVMFKFLFVTITILVVALWIILMRFYVKGKLYPFSNLILCNPFAFFPMTWNNLLCVIVTHQFIILVACFNPCVSHVEFSSSSSSSIYQLSYGYNGIFCFLIVILLWDLF